MIRILIVAFSLVAAGAGHAADRPKLAPVLGGVIDLSSPMTDENGNLQSLGALANGKPTLILLGYHRCKNLCGFAERDLAENLISTHLPPDAYSVVFASVDPYETTGDAQASKATLALAAPNADLSRWRFVTMDSVTSARLEKALGVSVLSMNRDIYVHPVAIAAVTASGRLSGMLSGLSRDFLNDQRIDSSLQVQGSHGCVDCAVEGVGISEGLMCQMVRLEIVPDNLDVVEFGCVFWQPLDGEPVFARLDGFTSELADMDRPVVLDQYDRFYCPSWLRTEQVVELLEVSDEVAAALGLARMHNQLARDMIE